MHANDPTLIQLYRNGCSPSHQYGIAIKRMKKKLDTDDIKSNCTEMDALPLINQKIINMPSHTNLSRNENLPINALQI